MNVQAFVIITALIIVTTKLTLSFMEDRDLAKGLPVNHREYTFDGLLGIMATERLDKWKENWKRRFAAIAKAIKSLFRKRGKENA